MKMRGFIYGCTLSAIITASVYSIAGVMDWVKDRRFQHFD